MNKHRTPLLSLCLAALLALSACLPPNPTAQPTPPAQVTEAATATSTTTKALSRTPLPSLTRASTRTATATATATITPTLGALGCETANPITAGLLEQVTPEGWLGWIRKLSGAEPVTVGGEQVTIETRFTIAMFDANYRPQPNARAFEYLLETVSAWYPPEQIQVQSFKTSSERAGIIRGQNLILTLPGTTHPEEEVLLTAHFDSMTGSHPERSAPGAEDNGSGSAALLEAARLFRDYRFERTIRIIWFTGEELGLLGSKAYTNSEMFHPENVVGVVNLDMFGQDSDGDRCFEMHVGTLPASDRVGRCFAASAQAYNLGLETFDYLTEEATSASDHSSFWKHNVGAIEILENLFPNNDPQGCANADPNPYYHTSQDTVEHINADSGIRIVRAALAAVAAMAGAQ